MPLDHYEDEDEKDGSAGGHQKDFDCPECSANNPLDDPLKDGQEVLCNYCGCAFLVKTMDNGRFKFREI